jgi:sugar O-acyltransferase (sialic acid O-acetyltransferase NeuD family)
MKPVIIIGGGGHAKVVASTLLLLRQSVLGFTDQDTSKTSLLGLPYMGDDGVILSYEPSEILLVNGVGSIRPGGLRAELFKRFKELGFSFLTLVHPAAVVAPESEIGEGALIFAGAVVQPGARIGPNCILNSRCSVDHDCDIGAHTHIAPGATLSGGVRTGPDCHIGVGATVIQGIEIGGGTLVGAGSVVVRPVAPGSTVMGVPARDVNHSAPDATHPGMAQ